MEVVAEVMTEMVIEGVTERALEMRWLDRLVD